jgi:hypothetical protein
MPLEASYQVDPALLGQAAYEAAAAQQARKNREETIPRQQRADEAALAAQLTREGRAQQAAIYGDQRQRAVVGDQFDYLANQENNARALEQERIRAEQDAEQEHAETIRSGLKDGTFYYSPDQANKMERLNRSLGAIQTDATLDDDLRQQMIETVIAERDTIQRTPMMRSRPKDPTPQEQFSQRSVLYSPSAKQMFEFGDPNVPDDAYSMTMNRSGAFQVLKDPNAVSPQTVASQQSAATSHATAIWKARLAATQKQAGDINLTEDERRAAQKNYQQLFDNPPAFGGGMNGIAAPPAATSGPVQVGSIQEALSLPPGTTFITPDGRTKVRP